nr:hypothetical protein [uncultured Hyphomonas sp.]
MAGYEDRDTRKRTTIALVIFFVLIGLLGGLYAYRLYTAKVVKIGGGSWDNVTQKFHAPNEMQELHRARENDSTQGESR